MIDFVVFFLQNSRPPKPTKKDGVRAKSPDDDSDWDADENDCTEETEEEDDFSTTASKKASKKAAPRSKARQVGYGVFFYSSIS